MKRLIHGISEQKDDSLPKFSSLPDTHPLERPDFSPGLCLGNCANPLVAGDPSPFLIATSVKYLIRLLLLSCTLFFRLDNSRCRSSLDEKCTVITFNVSEGGGGGQEREENKLRREISLTMYDPGIFIR